MEEKDIVNTTAEELSSAKPDYEKEIASIIRSNASPAQIKIGRASCRERV